MEKENPLLQAEVTKAVSGNDIPVHIMATADTEQDSTVFCFTPDAVNAELSDTYQFDAKNEVKVAAADKTTILDLHRVTESGKPVTYWFALEKGKSVKVDLSWTAKAAADQSTTQQVKLYAASAADLKAAKEAIQAKQSSGTAETADGSVSQPLALNWEPEAVSSEGTSSQVSSSKAASSEVSSSEATSAQVSSSEAASSEVPSSGASSSQASSSKTASSQTESKVVRQKLTASVYTDSKRTQAVSDGTSITVEGDLPQGTTAVAYPVQVSMEKANVLAAYDITLLDSTGKEFEPASPVKVYINTPRLKKAAGPVDIYHVQTGTADKSESTAAVKATVTQDKAASTRTAAKVAGAVLVQQQGTVQFSASSFSIYVVTSETISVGDTSALSAVSTLDVLACSGRSGQHRSALSTVSTLDSTAMGVTLQMFDYNSPANIGGGGYNGTTGSITQGLLSNKVGENGFPTCVNNGYSLSNWFTKGGSGTSYSNDANHLFLQSEYDKTHYLYYDGSQNFASFDKASGNFKVYNQLGTPNGDPRFFFQRGNFMPFNTLNIGNVRNHNRYVRNHNRYVRNHNRYDYLGHELPTSDARYNENLYGFNESNNYFFGMYMEANFAQPKNGLVNGSPMRFEFTGDDDMWVYIDGKLVLDLGGIHDAQSGYIDFSTGEVGFSTTSQIGGNYKENITSIKDMFKAANDNMTASTFDNYSTHKIQVFYMERGAGASNLRIKFNMPSVPKGKLSISKQVEGDADTNATYPMKLFVDGKVQANAAYTLNGDSTPYKTDENGVFQLKTRQTAVFDGIDDSAKYYVQELNSADYAVTFNGAKAVLQKDNTTAQSGDYTFDSDGSFVAVTNKVKTSGFMLHKVSKDSKTSLSGAQFTLYKNDKADGTGSWRAYLGADKTGVYTVDGSGQVNITNLPSGAYKLIETKAPAGYSALGEPVTFKVDARTGSITPVNSWPTDVSFENSTMTVKDEKGYVLPEAGGAGTGKFFGGGLLLMGAALCTWYLKKQYAKGSCR
ncbi:MAG: SpaA isopeptide-forming pilin-related protein [Oscillospiraceae bacterium]|nr:SpaA isopeptide-forming pilin-related protein [Oscillospiraceae bacterium]